MVFGTAALQDYIVEFDPQGQTVAFSNKGAVSKQAVQNVTITFSTEFPLAKGARKMNPLYFQWIISTSTLLGGIGLWCIVWWFLTAFLPNLKAKSYSSVDTEE